MLNIRTIYFLTFIVAMSWWSLAEARTPPLSQEVLQKEADLIVEGKISGPVQCLGKVKQTACSAKYRYSTPLQVIKVLKGNGQSETTLNMIFVYYDYGQSGCAGDQGPTIQEGQIGTYHLKKDGSDEYRLWHWSAVRIKQQGSGSLPPCK